MTIHILIFLRSETRFQRKRCRAISMRALVCTLWVMVMGRFKLFLLIKVDFVF